MARHIPIGDRYDGVNTVTLDGVYRRLISDTDTLTVVDTAGGGLGNIWQLVMLSKCVLVPTSLSWSDLRPTIDFVQELSERKEANDMSVPHVIISIPFCYPIPKIVREAINLFLRTVRMNAFIPLIQ